MGSDGSVKSLVTFFKTARHLFGRCPSCGSVFRLSDVAISTRSEPPRDWLRRLEQRQIKLDERESNILERESDVEKSESALEEKEEDLSEREYRLERDSKRRVQEILRSDTEVQKLIRAANKASVQRSRATLLGKLLERIAPCFRKFDYDPRDMRCICDPVDYVLFDGLTVDRQVREIRFIEVKCGRSRLTPVQRSVRDAVENQRVFTEVWEIGNPEVAITKQLSNGSRHALPPAPEADRSFDR